MLYRDCQSVLKRWYRVDGTVVQYGWYGVRYGRYGRYGGTVTVVRYGWYTLYMLYHVVSTCIKSGPRGRTVRVVQVVIKRNCREVQQKHATSYGAWTTRRFTRHWGGWMQIGLKLGESNTTLAGHQEPSPTPMAVIADRPYVSHTPTTIK